MTTSADPPPPADIDKSPTLLLAGLFAAHRSGDDVLKRVYQRRLTALGITVVIGPPGVPPPDTTAPPPKPVDAADRLAAEFVGLVTAGTPIDRLYHLFAAQIRTTRAVQSTLATDD